jgi:hypothetical protein
MRNLVLLTVLVLAGCAEEPYVPKSVAAANLADVPLALQCSTWATKCETVGIVEKDGRCWVRKTEWFNPVTSDDWHPRATGIIRTERDVNCVELGKYDDIEITRSHGGWVYDDIGGTISSNAIDAAEIAADAIGSLPE